MKKEFYKVTYFSKDDDFIGPFMHQCYSEEELSSFITYLKSMDKYNITVYKVIQTEEIINFDQYEKENNNVNN